MAPDTLERARHRLKDPTLLRQQCYVDGQWIDADDGATSTSSIPPPARRSAPCRVMGAAETRRAIDAADRAWPALARTRPRRSAARSCASGTSSCSPTATISR